jgi:hypothetical protein
MHREILTLMPAARISREWTGRSAAGFSGPTPHRGGAVGGAVVGNSSVFGRKKQGAAGITTAAPYIAGQWGRGG